MFDALDEECEDIKGKLFRKTKGEPRIQIKLLEFKGKK